MEANLLKWLDGWYISNCDGDWEHSYSLNIQSLDNPGWNFTVDLDNTQIYLEDINWHIIYFSENSWVGFKVENSVFNCASIPSNLALPIFVFKTLIEKGRITDEEILKFYNDTQW